MNASASNRNRDEFLDIAKGIAIILVVIGHALQSGDFDEKMGFKVIYSFHMPLFVFLSGAVASLWIKPKDICLGLVKNSQKSAARLRRASVRLLLPFVCWTIIGYLINRRSEGFESFMVKVLMSPDWSLWFLVCIFHCTALFLLLQIVLAGIYSALSRVDIKLLPKNLFDSGWMRLIFIYIVWRILAPWLPNYFGIPLARDFFVYFLLGIAFYQYAQPFHKGILRVIPYALFLLLVPLWHRTTAGHIAAWLPSFPGRFLVDQIYPFAIALSGILVVVDISKRLCEKNISPINKILVFCGNMSLGIYAIHYYFLGYTPFVIAPLAISALLSYVFFKTPGLRTALLGEQSKKLDTQKEPGGGALTSRV